MRVTLRFASLRHRRPDENGGSARRDLQFSLRTPVSLILSSFLLHVCMCANTLTISPNPPLLSPLQFNWVATMLAPDDSPYKNGMFYLAVKFPKDYPLI